MIRSYKGNLCTNTFKREDTNPSQRRPEGFSSFLFIPQKPQEPKFDFSLLPPTPANKMRHYVLNAVYVYMYIPFNVNVSELPGTSGLVRSEASS